MMQLMNGKSKFILLALRLSIKYGIIIVIYLMVPVTTKLYTKHLQMLNNNGKLQASSLYQSR